MKNIGNKRAGLIGSAFATIAMVVALSAGTAAAATNTVYEWTGASSTIAGANGCTSNCWSVAGNWNVSTDGGTTFAAATTAPQSTDNGGNGDDIWFDITPLTATANLTNDLTNLTVNTLTLKGTNASGWGFMVAGSAFTLMGGALPANSGYVTFNAPVTIGASETNQNSNIDFSDVTVPSGVTYTASSATGVFHGAGTVTIDGGTSQYGGYGSFYQNSDFSGTINVASGSTLSMDQVDIANYAAVTMINVAAGGQIMANADGSTNQNQTYTIANAIHLNGSAGVAQYQSKGAIIGGTQIGQSQWAGTLTVNFTGDITLDGDTVVAAEPGGTTTYNFAKLTMNGHTLTAQAPAANTYGTTVLNLPSSATAGSSAPKTPNTGFRLIAANPVQTLAVSAVAFLVLASIAYKVRTSGARR